MIDGKLLASPMVFHFVDAIDFRHLAMKAVEKGQDPIAAIDNSWLVKNHEFARKAWEWNKAEVAKIEKELAPRARSRPPRSAIASAGRISFRCRKEPPAARG